MNKTEFSKSCPTCGEQQFFSKEIGLKAATKNNTICRKCASIKSGFTEKYASRGVNCGENNPFFGCHHTEESKKKIVQDRDFSVYKTEEFREKISKLSSGENNPMYGKSVHSTWVEKYGEETAKQKDIEWKQKLSIAFSGEKNPMYGKPTPKKAGNGWCGWYKDWFFRSLRELSYIINEVESNNLAWQSCEGLFRIDYLSFDGRKRTYCPDFLIENSKVIEIKPIKLHTSIEVTSKAKAAKDFFDKLGYEYILTDCDIIDFSLLEKMIDQQEIVLTLKTKERYEKYKETNNP